MLRPVLDQFGFIDPTGLVQAWGGVFAAYETDPSKLYVMFDTGAEKFLDQQNKGYGKYDGGIYIVQSGSDFYVYIGPGSGKEDYLAWAAIGIHATAFLMCNAWVNTLWSSYLLDIFAPIMNKISPLLTPASKINIIGYSLGGAMAVLLGRAIAAAGLENRVQTVGFGPPRAIGNNAPATPTVTNVRIAGYNDPVDLVPPQDMITLDGGTIPPLVVPTLWANVGLRFVLGPSPNLAPQGDLPWPGLMEFSWTLLGKIINHGTSYYSARVNGYYAAQASQGKGSNAGMNYVNLVNSLLTGDPIIPPPPVVVFAPLPPHQVDKTKPIIPPQIQGPPLVSLITPFVQGNPSSPNASTIPAGIGPDPY